MGTQNRRIEESHSDRTINEISLQGVTSTLSLQANRTSKAKQEDWVCVYKFQAEGKACPKGNRHGESLEHKNVCCRVSVACLLALGSVPASLCIAAV